MFDASRPFRPQHDVAFGSHEPWPAGKTISKQGDWDAIPGLAIDVLSPHVRDREKRLKLRGYSRYGVREVWIVLPDTPKINIYKSPEQIRVSKSWIFWKAK